MDFSIFRFSENEAHNYSYVLLRKLSRQFEKKGYMVISNMTVLNCLDRKSLKPGSSLHLGTPRSKVMIQVFNVFKTIIILGTRK